MRRIYNRKTWLGNEAKTLTLSYFWDGFVFGWFFWQPWEGADLPPFSTGWYQTSVDVQGVCMERAPPAVGEAREKPGGEGPGKKWCPPAPNHTVVYGLHKEGGLYWTTAPWSPSLRISCYQDLDKTNTRSTSTRSICIIIREKHFAGIDFGFASHRFHMPLYPIMPILCIWVIISHQYLCCCGSWFFFPPFLSVCFKGIRQLIGKMKTKVKKRED